MEERTAQRLLLWLVGLDVIQDGDNSPLSSCLAQWLTERVVGVIIVKGMEERAASRLLLLLSGWCNIIHNHDEHGTCILAWGCQIA